jgi:multidrug transporter EmrE-like cation transporter
MVGVEETTVGAGQLMRAAPYILGAAACYTAAMVLMKMWGAWSWPLMAAALIAVSVGAVWFDILALREERLGMIYVSVLAVESLLIAAVAVGLFGESFSTREAAGMALIVAGTAVAWS